MLINSHDNPAAAMLQGICLVILALFVVIRAALLDHKVNKEKKQERENTIQRAVEAHLSFVEQHGDIHGAPFLYLLLSVDEETEVRRRLVLLVEEKRKIHEVKLKEVSDNVKETLKDFNSSGKSFRFPLNDFSKRGE